MKRIILIMVLMTALFTGQLFAFVYANHSCGAYNACESDGYRGAGSSIGVLIIEGAGYFLKSHSEMLMLLNKVELSELTGPDYPGMQTLVNNALDNMEKASETYKNLIAAAKETPYNPEVITKLIMFDYETFRETNGLNKDIFSRIKKYLAKGDVTGVYVLLESDMALIIQQLKVVQSSMDAGVFPGISLLWRLNQKYSESLLSGQYTAEVFEGL
ncbi:MAG: hypothetical protein JSV88_11125 [Candidatus Aminicenantes bacterium]|nr:MAG: hypothetical protein JSV88_11125 [Candidatus Aminicenantes bacterium]